MAKWINENKAPGLPGKRKFLPFCKIYEEQKATDFICCIMHITAYAGTGK